MEARTPITNRSLNEKAGFKGGDSKSCGSAFIVVVGLANLPDCMKGTQASSPLISGEPAEGNTVTASEAEACVGVTAQ